MSATALVGFGVGVGIAVTLSLSPALAQEAPAEAVAEAPFVMDTLRVTARRAEESVKDVPFTVTVIGGDTVEERGTTSLESTLMGTPGINIGSYGDANNANMKIRGVGSLNRIGGDDSSVVLYVDGMPDNVSGLSAQTLDVERLEILKGPQGTLFGRNSEAGAINLVSRKPTDVLEGYVRGELGTGMYRLTEGAISGPIVGTLKGRFAFRYNGEDLWVDNARDGEPLTKPEDLTARGTLQWDPTDLTSLTVVASREVLTDHPGFMVLRPYGESPVMDVPPGSIVDEKWSSRISAEVTHTLPFAVATVFSGYTRMDWKTGGPFYEGRLYDTLIGMTPDSTRTVMIGRNVFNQELRLSSRPEEKVFWVAGANYYRSDWRSSNRDSFDAFYPTNPFNADIDRDYETESYALFGEVTVPVTESLKVTAGVRQTWEHKTYDAVWRATASNPSTLRVSRDKQELDDDYITGRLAFGYDVTPDLTVHGVYARGYKSGGWGDHGSNISMGLSDAPYDAAIVDSYELGMKSDFLDGDLTVNGALFWNTTRNDHLMLFDTTTFTTQARNFDTESKGIELEAAWRLGHGFTLGGSLAYTDASITGVPANSGTDVQVGNKVPHVPEWGWTLSLTHMMDLPERLIPLLPVRSTYRR